MKTLLNPYRAVGFSVLTYIGSFIVGIAVSMALGIDMAAVESPPEVTWYAGAVAAVIIAALATWGYFKKNSPKASVQTGACFGIVVIITGFVLDFLLFLPVILQEKSVAQLLKYYSDYRFWITLALVVASAAATGHFLGSKKKA